MTLLEKLVNNCFETKDPIPFAKKDISVWKDWLLPISDDSDIGGEITYEDDYLFIRDEIGKLTDIDSTRIIKCAENLLKNKAKDIRVVTYYIWARIHQDGEQGLAEGISLLAALVDTYGNHLLPSRPHTRKLAFDWLYSPKIKDTLSLYPEVEKNEVKRIVAALALLQQGLELWNEAERPDLTGLLVLLENRIERAGGIKTNLPQNSTSSFLVQNQEEPIFTGKIKSGRELLEQARFLADYLREQPEGWLASARLMRTIRWDSIYQLPSCNQDRQTRLAAPRSELKNTLKRLYTQQKWTELLEQTENIFMEGVNHFWLDIQWYVCQALSKSGTSYALWAPIIQNDLQMLLKRLSGLHELAYENGTPFADEVTRTWIEQQVIIEPVSLFDNQKNMDIKQEQNSILNMEEEALKMIDQEGENATFNWLMNLPNMESVKNRWLQKLLMARICEQCGKNDMAVHLLQDLERTGYPYQLSQWEPDLMFEVKARLLNLLRIKSKNSEKEKNRYFDKMDTLLSDLVSIDPARASILFT